MNDTLPLYMVELTKRYRLQANRWLKAVSHVSFGMFEPASASASSPRLPLFATIDAVCR